MSANRTNININQRDCSWREQLKTFIRSIGINFNLHWICVHWKQLNKTTNLFTRWWREWTKKEKKRFNANYIWQKIQLISTWLEREKKYNVLMKKRRSKLEQSDKEKKFRRHLIESNQWHCFFFFLCVCVCLSSMP